MKPNLPQQQLAEAAADACEALFQFEQFRDVIKSVEAAHADHDCAARTGRDQIRRSFVTGRNPMSFAIVKDHPSLLKYIESLQAKNSDALGFLPRVVFERRSEAGQLFLGLLNGEPAGYILAGSGFQGVMRCQQVCIQYDVRRRLYGAMLVAAVEQYGEECGCSRISLRCGSDLPANGFWLSLGYVLDSTEKSGAARRQRRDHLNVWSKSLHPALLATAWKNGRPRIYLSNALRQAAYRERLLLQNPRVAGMLRNSVAAPGLSETAEKRSGRALGVTLSPSVILGESDVKD